MLYTSANSTMEQLFEEFNRVGRKHVRNREIITMIYEWGNAFFVEKEESFSDLLDQWAGEAKEKDLEFPLFDDVDKAINHKAITPAKFFDYFIDLFILND